MIHLCKHGQAQQQQRVQDQHPALPPKGSGFNPSCFSSSRTVWPDSTREHNVFALGAETNDAVAEVPSLLHKAACQKEPHRLTQGRSSPGNRLIQLQPCLPAHVRDAASAPVHRESALTIGQNFKWCQANIPSDPSRSGIDGENKGKQRAHGTWGGLGLRNGMGLQSTDGKVIKRKIYCGRMPALQSSSWGSINQHNITVPNLWQPQAGPGALSTVCSGRRGIQV